MPKGPVHLIRLLCLAVMLLLLHAGATAEEPWSVQASAPVFGGTAAPSQRYTAAAPDSFGKTSGFIWLKIYQNGLSPLVNSKCAMVPSCSHYSLEAVEKYGAARGILLTADRLLHEGRIARVSPVVRTPEKVLYIDPVENNVLWRQK